MIKTVIIILFFLDPMNFYSQTNTGVLKGGFYEKDSKEPIIGGTLQLMSDLSKGAVTDVKVIMF